MRSAICRLLERPKLAARRVSSLAVKLTRSCKGVLALATAPMPPPEGKLIFLDKPYEQGGKPLDPQPTHEERLEAQRIMEEKQAAAARGSKAAYAKFREAQEAAWAKAKAEAEAREPELLAPDPRIVEMLAKDEEEQRKKDAEGAGAPAASGAEAPAAEAPAAGAEAPAAATS